jgi:16S rRNA (guanine966-N2)-methyltransferase
MRICGGVHRSRILASPRGAATRPTSDRVREALFSILAARGVVVGARVVDLYAGTGALGLEALSRGASFATFVESDRRALEALVRNVEALRERARTRILPIAVTRAVTNLAGDDASLIFCDPPYAEVRGGGVARLLDAVARQRVAGRPATVVLEHATRDEPVASAMLQPATVTGLHEKESRTYGDTTLTFFLLEGAAS